MSRLDFFDLSNTPQDEKDSCAVLDGEEESLMVDRMISIRDIPMMMMLGVSSPKKLDDLKP